MNDAELEGARFPTEDSLAARAMTRGTTVTSVDERELLGGRLRIGPTAAVPLVASGQAVGALCVIRRPGEAEFTRAEVETVADFASEAGIAIALAWARRDRQRLDVVEDRARIARDLHDHVIQRLFAIGLTLQALAAADTGSAAQLEEQISELDAAIAQIRTAIFTLRVRPTNMPTTPRHRLLDVVTELTPALATAPRMIFKGPIDLMLTEALADDVVAVVRESLANVARHAHAHDTALSVTVTQSEIAVSVDDDGDGIQRPISRRGGTGNLADRAARRGGRYSLERRPEGGTRARWVVPFPADTRVDV